VRASQIRAVVSHDAVTTRFPSGLNWADVSNLRLCRRLLTSAPRSDGAGASSRIRTGDRRFTKRSAALFTIHPKTPARAHQSGSEALSTFSAWWHIMTLLRQVSCRNVSEFFAPIFPPLNTRHSFSLPWSTTNGGVIGHAHGASTSVSSAAAVELPEIDSSRTSGQSVGRSGPLCSALALVSPYPAVRGFIEVDSPPSENFNPNHQGSEGRKIEGTKIRNRRYRAPHFSARHFSASPSLECGQSDDGQSNIGPEHRL